MSRWWDAKAGKRILGVGNARHCLQVAPWLCQPGSGTRHSFDSGVYAVPGFGSASTSTGTSTANKATPNPAKAMPGHPQESPFIDWRRGVGPRARDPERQKPPYRQRMARRRPNGIAALSSPVMTVASSVVEDEPIEIAGSEMAPARHESCGDCD